MTQRHIGTLLDRKAINDINDNFTELYDRYIGAGLDAAEAKEKAIQAVADSLYAKQTAETTRDELTRIIREQTAGGDVVPEVVQARGTHNTVGERLNSISQDLAQITTKVDNTLLDDFEFVELNYPTSPPNFPSIKPPFRVYRDIDNLIKHDFDFDSFEENAGHIYVQGYGGNDTNDGLTKATPVSTLPSALAKADALEESTVVIHFLENAYDDSRFYPYQFTLNKNIVLKSDSPRGKTFFHGGTRANSITWTADGAAYKCSRSGATKVFDTSIQDGYLPKEYKKVNSVAEVQAEEGTWYTDGTSVWVRRLGDLTPDKDISITLLRGIGIKFDIGSNVFVTRNMEFYVETNIDDALSVHSVGSGEYWNDNCVFDGSLSRNGLAIMDVLKTYSFNSIAKDNYLDGFNYHAPTIDINNQHYAFEYNCKGFYNGTSAISNANASTAHDGFAILRINGEYHDTYGPVIADVNGCFSVLYDCVAYNSLRPIGTAKAAFYFDNSSAVKNGEAHLINCAGGGFETDSIATYDIPVYIHKHKGKAISGTGDVTIV